MVDTTDQWIQERTGIRERRLASPCTSVCDMGTAAAQQALERAGVTAKDVDLLLVSTATPDRLLPSTACDIQARLGASKAAAMDISAACTGFCISWPSPKGTSPVAWERWCWWCRPKR